MHIVHYTYYTINAGNVTLLDVEHELPEAERRGGFRE